MYIAHINIAGTETSTGGIAKAIIDKCSCEGHEGKLFYCVGISDNANSTFSVKFENGLPMFYRKAMNKIFGKNGKNAVLTTRNLINRLKKEKPDIIHLHVIHQGLIDYEQLFKFLIWYDHPVVITLHDCWFYTGGCYHYSRIDCNGFFNGCKNCINPKLDCLQRKTSENLCLKKNFYDKLDNLYVVGVSKWITQEAKKSILKNKDISTIYNGVDNDVFYNKKEQNEVVCLRKKLLCNKKHLIIGVSSNWNDSKGLSDFYLLADKLGNDFKIILVGNKGDNISHSSNLEFIGPVYDKEELSKYYSASDVLVNLSIEESFGLVSVEAICCGTMVIGYRSTANTEVLESCGGMLIDDIGNMDCFANSIISYCDSNEKCETKTNKFSLDEMTKNYLELYEKIYEKDITG